MYDINVKYQVLKFFVVFAFKKRSKDLLRKFIKKIYEKRQIEIVRYYLEKLNIYD